MHNLPETTLSIREVEIMSLIKAGLSAKEISCEINRCQRTVEKHIATVKLKLKAKNIAHAVALFVENYNLCGFYDY